MRPIWYNAVINKTNSTHVVGSSPSIRTLAVIGHGVSIDDAIDLGIFQELVHILGILLAARPTQHLTELVTTGLAPLPQLGARQATVLIAVAEPIGQVDSAVVHETLGHGDVFGGLVVDLEHVVVEAADHQGLIGVQRRADGMVAAAALGAEEPEQRLDTGWLQRLTGDIASRAGDPSGVGPMSWSANQPSRVARIVQDSVGYCVHGPWVEDVVDGTAAAGGGIVRGVVEGAGVDGRDPDQRENGHGPECQLQHGQRGIIASETVGIPTFDRFEHHQGESPTKKKPQK
ncbi:hypothetical protein NUU61_005498 [Penicillium alfredii]|uniref:Uncharacterized protein n=1 Tax=Penicillium alfredii TaxID=1506179 RepID=A0A9W9FA01_9EURO|nr:uncharacterized protein NUU61_005498 [Penicillium alfredii]KAJ5096142.1 hypothetical protein NUU61_005498 [Penicillium alfredii]